jgi:hypothetical protein
VAIGRWQRCAPNIYSPFFPLAFPPPHYIFSIIPLTPAHLRTWPLPSLPATNPHPPTCPVGIRSGRPQTDLDLDLHLDQPPTSSTHRHLVRLPHVGVWYAFHTSVSGTSIFLSPFCSISFLPQDNYHGHEETAKMCSRYINTLFHCPDQPQPSSTSQPGPDLPHFIASPSTAPDLWPP